MSELKHKNTILPVIILLLIVVLGVGLRLIYRCGYCNPDAFYYINAVSRLNDDGIRQYLASIANIYENRISITLPLALIVKLFGFSEFTIMLLPLLYAVGTIIVVYFLGQRLFTTNTALFAALMAATIPLDVLYSTSITPDSLIPFYIGLTLLCFVIGQQDDQPLFYILSGFFLFCAFEARATSGILIFPLFLIAWWSPKRNIWSLLLPAGSFLAITLLYWGILFLISGDFLLQIKLLSQDATVKTYVGTGELLGHFKNIFKISGEFGLLYVIAFPACIIGLYKAISDEAYRLPVITFVTLYLFFEFGSTTLTTYQPIWKLSRFLTILTVPVALMVAAVTLFILSTSPRWVRLTTFMLVSTHILLATVFPIYNRQVTQVVLYYEAPYKVTFARLNSYDDVGTLHIEHGRWALRGTFYNNLVGRAYQYEIMKDQTANDIVSGDIVIYDPLFFTPYAENRLAIEDYPALQTLPEQPPDNWELLFTAERLPQPDYPVYVYRVK